MLKGSRGGIRKTEILKIRGGRVVRIKRKKNASNLRELPATA